MADPNAVLKDLTGVVRRTLGAKRPSIVPRLCQRVVSDGAYEKFVFPSAPAQPTLFLDQRKPTEIDVNNVYELKSDEYELTLDIKRSLLEDAKAYNFDWLIADAVDKAVMFEDMQCSAMIEAGATSGNVSYDGNTFYGDTHNFANAGANNIDNKQAGTGITLDQMDADFSDAVATLQIWKDNTGSLLNPQDLASAGLVWHGHPKRAKTMKRLMNTTLTPIYSGNGVAAGDNVLQGMADVMSDGYLTDETDSYLHITGLEGKPFVLIDRMAGLAADMKAKGDLVEAGGGGGPMWEVIVMGPGSEFYTNNNKARIALRRRFKLGYMLFYRSIRITN